MFRCTKPPPAEVFAPNLDALGFEYRAGQFFNKGTAEHFKYFHTDNENVNNRRKEAIHEAARKVVCDELAKFDIVEVHLPSASSIVYKMVKPDVPYVTLMATEPGKLRNKRDVIVIVGEEAAGLQDAGIWAYRTLMRDGGVENGSAVGMATKLAEHAQAGRSEDFEEDYDHLGTKFQHLALDEGTDEMPGMIMLNPGQLYYSNAEGKPMSAQTWKGRQRKNATDPDFEIDRKYNTVPGHRSPSEHIVTTFENVIPYIINEHAHIYIVAIGDSCEHTIEYLDQLFINKLESGLAQQIEAVLLIDPKGVDPECYTYEPFRNFLCCSAKSWVNSPAVPYGRLINVPNKVRTEYEGESLANWDLETGERIDSGLPQREKPLITAEDEQRHNGIDGEKDFDEVSISDTYDHEIDADWVDVKDDAYAMHKEPVICPTLSAGDCDFTTELVMPKVMDSVIEYIMEKRASARHYERLNGRGGHL